MLASSEVTVPSPMTVTVKTFVFHCAYRVVLAVIVKVAPAEYAVPDPSGAVFHPSNQYPSFERVHSSDTVISAPGI